MPIKPDQNVLSSESFRFSCKMCIVVAKGNTRTQFFWTADWTHLFIEQGVYNTYYPGQENVRRKKKFFLKQIGFSHFLSWALSRSRLLVLFSWCTSRLPDGRNICIECFISGSFFVAKKLGTNCVPTFAGSLGRLAITLINDDGDRLILSGERKKKIEQKRMGTLVYWNGMRLCACIRGKLKTYWFLLRCAYYMDTLNRLW